MIFGVNNKTASCKSLLKGVFLKASLVLLLVAGAQTAWAADAAKGTELFKANCARCHNAKLEKASTGPALLGASSRIPGGDWKYRWIQNSAKLIGEGDAYAVKIWNENNKASMDPFPQLTNADIDDIFAYIDAYQPADGGGGPTSGVAGVNLEEDEKLSGLWSWIKILVFLVVAMLASIAMQLARLRGVEFLGGINLEKWQPRLFLGFFVIGMASVFYYSYKYSPYYIQTNSASVHGEAIDQMFWITMVVVFSVFVLVNGVLFYFVWKYGKEGDRKAKFYPENHKLEMLWTVVPAIVLTVLVIFGIRAWTQVMSKPEAGKPTMLVEINGQQWGWILRYPGDDGKLGAVDVRRIGGDNIIGVVVDDPATKDDFISEDLVLCEDMIVDLKIRSRDVLHSVFLPHFRVKMDAVPGMDTRFHFIPRHTTDEFRAYLLANNEYWSQVDTVVTTTIEPDSNAAPGTKPVVVTDTVYKADKFDYELACTEVCGRGHFSMRKKVVVLPRAEYDKWYAEQKKGTIMSQMTGTSTGVDEPQISSSVKPGEVLDK